MSTEEGGDGTRTRRWPILSYYDIGEIVDEQGNTVLQMPGGIADDELGQRICRAFNSYDTTLQALRASAEHIGKGAPVLDGLAIAIRRAESDDVV